MTHPTRRSVLQGSGALLASAWLPRGSFAQSDLKFESPLAIPPLHRGTVTDGVREIDLTVRAAQTEFFSGLKTDTLGINGSYLGPAVRVRKGEKVRMKVQNTLDTVTTLHWHGLNVPAAADGGPHQVIEPGATWTPEFTVQDAAATMWFHAHPLHQTANQVWAGLAGLLVIDDDASDALDLPGTWGVDDIPVILQDRRFNRDGSMPYATSMHDEMAGMIGNIPLVNGTVLPKVEVGHEAIRLRLLNGSNASIYNLEFSDGRTFQQIASDGGFLNAPAETTTLRLAPGERAELVVAFAPGETVRLVSVPGGTAGGGGMGMGMGRGMMMEQSPSFHLVEFRAGQSLAPSKPLPQRLNDLAAPDPSTAAATRPFELAMPGMGPMRMLGLGGGFTINGKSMDMGRIDFEAKRDTSEVWVVSNVSPMAHPFHVHNTQFRVLDRDGRPPAPGEAGRKDTVVVGPQETVRILVHFDHYADKALPYMFHCHILEHEDAGMMGQFTVV